MSQYKVKTQDVKNAANDMETYQSKISALQESVNSVRSALSFEISSSRQIRRSLNQVSDQLGAKKDKLKKMGSTLNDIAGKYEEIETRIIDAAKDGKVTFWEKAAGSVADHGSTSFFDFDLDMDDLRTLSNTIQQKFGSSGFTDKMDAVSDKWDELNDKWDEVQDKVDDWNDAHKKEKSKQGYWENGQYHDVDSDDEAAVKKHKDSMEDEKLEGKVKVVEVSYQVDESVWGLEGKYEGEYGKVNGEVQVLEGEFAASAYGGLYSVGPDGEKVFRPGVGGEIGASVTAFTASGMAMLGSDDLGIYAEGEVNAGKAEAKAEAALGFGKDGKFSANVEASAEAMLVEATAAVGGKLLGTDVKGEVGVNVGVGAHAEVGYHDGKIKFDVGASLGVGISVDLEIDVSGTVEKVGSAISDGISAIAGWFD